jgi:hypothetical protein
MPCVIQNNGLVLGVYADSDNPNNGHPMSLSRSSRLELVPGFGAQAIIVPGFGAQAMTSHHCARIWGTSRDKSSCARIWGTGG